MAHVMDADLPPKRKWVLMAIANVVDGDTWTGWISQKSVAASVPCTEEYVRTSVAWLAAHGYVEVVEKGVRGRATVYRVLRFEKAVDDTRIPPTGAVFDTRIPPTVTGVVAEIPPTGEGVIAEDTPNSEGVNGVPSAKNTPNSDGNTPNSDGNTPNSGTSTSVLYIHPSTSKDKSGAAKPPKARKRATPAPDSLPITEAMREWAAKTVPQVDTGDETEKFLDYCRANGRCFIDWTSAWRNWMRRAPQFGPQAKPVRNPDTYVADMNQRIAHRRAAEDGAAAKLREIL